MSRRSDEPQIFLRAHIGNSGLDTTFCKGKLTQVNIDEYLNSPSSRIPVYVCDCLICDRKRRLNLSMETTEGWIDALCSLHASAVATYDFQKRSSRCEPIRFEAMWCEDGSIYCSGRRGEPLESHLKRRQEVELSWELDKLQTLVAWQKHVMECTVGSS